MNGRPYEEVHDLEKEKRLYDLMSKKEKKRAAPPTAQWGWCTWSPPDERWAHFVPESTAAQTEQDDKDRKVTMDLGKQHTETMEPGVAATHIKIDEFEAAIDQLSSDIHELDQAIADADRATESAGLQARNEITEMNTTPGGDPMDESSDPVQNTEHTMKNALARVDNPSQKGEVPASSQSSTDSHALKEGEAIRMTNMVKEDAVAAYQETKVARVNEIEDTNNQHDMEDASKPSSPRTPPR